ncbi:MAG TPA: hypothetical protein VEL70_02600 [Candidatus Acidoferrum sp.]|nr:hypothetical protein [Candidatus Acidoferrum sp.]
MARLDHVVLPDETPIGFQQVQPIFEEKPSIGFTETVKNIFKRENSVYTAINYINDKNLAAPAPGDEDVPDDWKALNEQSIVGIPKQYWPELAKANTPKELQIIQTRIGEQIDLDQRIGRGGFVGRLAGSLVAGAIDPINLLPVYGQLKYAKLGAGFIKNTIKAAPQMALATGLSEAVIVASQETKDKQDWIWNTLTGAVVGSVLSGGIKSLGDARTISKQTKILNAIDEDISFKADLNPDGTFKDYKAEANPGSSVGAAAVKDLQHVVNEGIADFGENAFFKLATKFSPNSRLLTSDYQAAREWALGVFDNSYITNGIKQGIIPETSAERKLITWMSLKDSVLNDARNMYYDSLDMKGPLKDIRSHFEKTNPWDKVSEEACNALRSGEKSDNPLAQQIALHTRVELMDKIYNQFTDRNILKPGIKPKTAESYFTRIWDRDTLSVNENEFIDCVTSFLKHRNEELFNLEAPLKIHQASINSLKEDIKASKSNPETLKSLESRLKELTSQEESIRGDIQSKIDSGEIKPLYTEGRSNLDLAQEVQYKELVKPLREAEEALKSAKTSSEKRAAKEAIKREKQALNDKMARGEVNEGLFYTTYPSNKPGEIKYHLIDQEKKPWLSTHIPETEWYKVAKSYHTSLMLQKDEQVMAEAFGAYERGGVNPLKERTVMLPDVGFGFEKFLVNDLEKVLSVYTGFSSRKLGLHDFFSKYGISAENGKEEFIAKLISEKEAKRQSVLKRIEVIPEAERAKAIDENVKKGMSPEQAALPEYTPTERLVDTPKTKERDDAIRKIDKSFEKTLSDINDSNSVFWGNYTDRSTTLSRVLKSQRDLAASTMRGAVLLVALPETFAPIFKAGPWTYVKDGLIPTLKYLINNKTLRKQDFADAGIAVETALGNHMDRIWGDGGYYPDKTVPEKVLSNAAKISGNLFLVNQLTDFNKSVAANIAQAKILRLMEKYTAGKKLTQKEIEYLGEIRLDPDKWGKRIMNEFNTPGIGERIDGSYTNNFRKWKDFDASQAFRSALSKEVDMVISKPNMLDLPFSMRNPVIASMTQFMSWSFGATSNYLLPLLQRPDAEKVVSMLLMMSAASMVGPMRQLAAGQEVDMNPDTLFKEAFFNSGVLGIYGDVPARLLAAFDLPFAPHRYKKKSFSEMVLGPLGGLGQMGMDLVNSAISGQMTESDVKKLIRLIPFMNAFYLRKLTNQWVDTLSLPQKRGTVSE